MEQSRRKHARHAEGRLVRWWRRWRSRRELARVDRRVLRDAGIHLLDAEREARKRFWQP